MGQIGRLAPCVCVALMLTPNLCHSNETIVPEALRQKASAEGTVRVIVQLRVSALPEGELSSAEAVASQRRAIASAQSAVLTELAGASAVAPRVGSGLVAPLAIPAPVSDRPTTAAIAIPRDFA